MRPFSLFGPAIKRFSFTLETVKRLRADAEQQAQAELGRRIAAHAAAERARELRARTLGQAEQELVGRSGLAHDLARADRERDAARLRLGAAAHSTLAAAGQVDAQRVSLTEASRALEVLERLEAQRRLAHRTAALAEEEAVVQELSESRAARRATERRRRP